MKLLISQLCALASKAVMPLFLTCWVNNLLLQSGTAPKGKIKAWQYSLLLKLFILNEKYLTFNHSLVWHYKEGEVDKVPSIAFLIAISMISTDMQTSKNIV